MNFVADCSIAMAWLLKDEATEETDEVLDLLGRGASAVVPALWRWEVSNVLLMAERRRRITKGEVNSHLSLLGSLPIVPDEMATNQAWNSTYLLAQKHGLTSYDAAYLEVALRRGLPLASLDSQLRQAAKAEKLDVLPEG